MTAQPLLDFTNIQNLTIDMIDGKLMNAEANYHKGIQIVLGDGSGVVYAKELWHRIDRIGKDSIHWHWKGLEEDTFIRVVHNLQELCESGFQKYQSTFESRIAQCFCFYCGTRIRTCDEIRASNLSFEMEKNQQISKYPNLSDSAQMD